MYTCRLNFHSSVLAERYDLNLRIGHTGGVVGRTYFLRTEKDRCCRPGEVGTPRLKVVADGPSAVSRSALDENVLEGARRMLAAALEAEVAAYIDRYVEEVHDDGRRLVVRNGHAEPVR